MGPTAGRSRRSAALVALVLALAAWGPGGGGEAAAGSPGLGPRRVPGPARGARAGHHRLGRTRAWDSAPRTPPSPEASALAGHPRQRPLRFGRNVVCWVVGYLWVFKSHKLLDKAMHSPSMEAIVYAALGLVPLVMLRASLFVREVTDLLGWIQARTKSCTLRHLMHCAKDPWPWAVRAVLLFLSVNMFAMAFPNSFTLALPRHLRFLDPNGDGILTAREIELIVARHSLNFLMAVVTSCLGAFVLSVKRPPKDFNPHDKQNLLEMYWSSRNRHSGITAILDLALTAAVVIFTALQWFRLFGLDAKTVLTFGGISGLAVALAAQSLVGNFISGILIRVMRPFVIGDWIATNGASGIVRGITWSYTRIETDEGPMVFLPNTDIVSALSMNRSQGSTRSLEVEVRFAFPSGGFQTCRELLTGLEEHVASLDLLQGRIVGRPEARFAVGHLTLAVDLDNKGLGSTDGYVSELHIEVVRYLVDQGCTVPELEA